MTNSETTEKHNHTSQGVSTEPDDGIRVVVADASHEKYVDTILQTITESAKVRGSGIASRTHEYLAKKMAERLTKTTSLRDFATLRVGKTSIMLPTLV